MNDWVHYYLGSYSESSDKASVLQTKNSAEKLSIKSLITRCGQLVYYLVMKAKKCLYSSGPIFKYFELIGIAFLKSGQTVHHVSGTYR